MKRWFIGVGSAIALAGGSGCGQQCTPEPDLTVNLVQAAEDVRALPVLSSGKLSLLGVEVPDSHGDVSVQLSLEGADSISVEDLTFTQSVGGADKDVSLVRVQQGDAEYADGNRARNDDRFRFLWRMQELADYVLAEGTAAASTVALNWRFAGCRTQTGVATVEVPQTVRSANTLKNLVLQSAEAGRLDLAQGPMAKMVVTSNVSNDTLVGVSNENLMVTFFSEGLPPLIGLGLADAPQIALRVNGMPTSQIAPGQSMEIFTSSRSSTDAPYDHAGQAASATALVGGGKALVKLEVSSERASGTAGPQRDIIYSLVDVP